jgi:hypothetical protein
MVRSLMRIRRPELAVAGFSPPHPPWVHKNPAKPPCFPKPVGGVAAMGNALLMQAGLLSRSATTSRDCEQSFFDWEIPAKCAHISPDDFGDLAEQFERRIALTTFHAADVATVYFSVQGKVFL